MKTYFAMLNEMAEHIIIIDKNSKESNDIYRVSRFCEHFTREFFLGNTQLSVVI